MPTAINGTTGIDKIQAPAYLGTMTTTQKNAVVGPAAGMLVFDTTLAKLCVYSGSAWQTVTSV